MMTFEILTIIVLVNIGATITLWRRAAWKPEKLDKKFFTRVFDTEPITPKHQPPPLEFDTPGVFGKEAKTGLMRFFSDFAEFANVVNWWLEDYEKSPWRLQDLPEVELSLHGDFRYGPRYARSYAIFHNQVRLGTLEIDKRTGYSAESPQVTTYIQLEYARVLPFDVIRTFLINIADHTCDFTDTKERFQAEQAIDRALTEVLWRMSHVSRFVNFGEDYGELNLRLDGTASYYIGRRDCEAFQELKSSIQR